MTLSISNKPLAWLIAGLGFCLSACGTTSPTPPDGLRNPRGIALACVSGDTTKPLSACGTEDSVRAFVTGGSLGSVAIAHTTGSGESKSLQWLDTDTSVPGFTPLVVGDLPTTIVADLKNPQWLYMTLALGQELVRMDAAKPSKAELKRLALSFTPTAMVVTAAGQLFLADAAGGAVWRVEASAFDSGTAAAMKIETGGSPHGLTVVAKTDELYVSHRDHAHVTVIALKAGAVSGRISLGPACGDGLDNDLDGQTDTADSGCDSRTDRFEGDPEVGSACADGKDNDGDGQTDDADLGCMATSTVDACRDGVDNDGDGKTDFPADSGCIGFASNTERANAASCADGLDNDGDGKTDVADAKCATETDDTELAPVEAGVTTACNDGIDNDGDGKVDLDDADCDGASSDGELRAACNDGIDNDGDGKTDLADSACVSRASASEVLGDTSPIAKIASTFGGEWVVVTRQRDRSALIIDTKTRTLLVPGASDGAPFRRASILDRRDGVFGVALGAQPLALTPVTFKGRDAIAVAMQLSGLVILEFAEDVPVEPRKLDDNDNPITTVKSTIGLALDKLNPTQSARPTLTIAGKSLDMGTKPPQRHASFGSLSKQTSDDGETRYYGIAMSEASEEHRSESWKIRAEGQIPGSERHSGQLPLANTLVDPTADFCRLGVVAGDMLLIKRGTGAKDCGGLQGDTLRYRITKVAPTSLQLEGGVVDQPLTLANQLNPPAAIAVPLPTAGCLPRRSIHYEVRADGWLVEGSRTGLLSRRGSTGGTCSPWDNSDPAQAARISRTTAKGSLSEMNCPITAADLSLLQSVPYGQSTPGDLKPFKNLVWSGIMQPGCAASDVPGQAPTLLAPVRDTEWVYALQRGFLPLISIVGTNPVTLQSGPGLTNVWVADQGSGSLFKVPLTSAFKTPTQLR
ncbi:MAG: hypothetical protein KC502_03090 [Myxococcales bacterium]|nr:hypothetical protein [Myxococcales bacterium]